jgi:hypothetical protein
VRNGLKIKNKKEKFTTIILSFIIFIGMIATYKLLNSKEYYESYNLENTQNTTYTQISDISIEKSHNSEISKYDFKETTSVNFYKGFEKTFKTPTTTTAITIVETTVATSSITNCETVLNTIEQSNIIQPTVEQIIIEQPTVAYIEPSITNTTIQTTQEVAVGYKPVDKLSIDLQNHIYNLCVENGVSFSIIMSIIEKESNFNASASNGVCIGLMQLHSAYNSGDLYDAYHNTELGIKLIGRLVTTYGLEQGLVYYNCGEYSGVYAPTSYSNSVISNSKKYE